MTVEKSKLGLEGNDLVAIMDVKCDPEMTSMIIQTYGFLPGYHMNKQHWITILLDGSVSEAKTLDFLDMSYDLIDGAGGKEEKWLSAALQCVDAEPQRQLPPVAGLFCPSSESRNAGGDGYGGGLRNFHFHHQYGSHTGHGSEYGQCQCDNADRFVAGGNHGDCRPGGS